MAQCHYLLPAFLFNRFHKPFCDVAWFVDNAAGIFGKLVHLDQEHARTVLLEHFLKFIDEIITIHYSLHIHIAGRFGDLFQVDDV